MIFSPAIASIIIILDQLYYVRPAKLIYHYISTILEYIVSHHIDRQNFFVAVAGKIACGAREAS